MTAENKYCVVWDCGMGLGMVVYLLVPVGYLSKHSSVECWLSGEGVIGRA